MSWFQTPISSTIGKLLSERAEGLFFNSFYFSCAAPLVTAALRQRPPDANGDLSCLVPRRLARGAEDYIPILHPHFFLAWHSRTISAASIVDSFLVCRDRFVDLGW